MILPLHTDFVYRCTLFNEALFNLVLCDTTLTELWNQNIEILCNYYFVVLFSQYNTLFFHIVEYTICTCSRNFNVNIQGFIYSVITATNTSNVATKQYKNIVIKIKC